METQKIINLLNYSSTEESNFTTKKCCIIDSQPEKDKYDQNSSITFEPKGIKSSQLQEI